MRKWSGIRFIPVLVLPFCLVLSPLAQERKGAEGVYTITPGDRLRETPSNALEAPILLAKLWQSNPYIADSHRINPEEPVRLANGDDSMKEEPPKTVVEGEQKETVIEPKAEKEEPPPVEKKAEEAVEVKGAEEKPKAVEESAKAVEEQPKAVEEQPKAVEEKPKAVEEKQTVFPEVRSAGFFSDVDYSGIGGIVESKDGKTFVTTDDIVYVAFKTLEPISIGNKYTIFRAQALVTQPVTGKRIGRRYNIMGTLQIIDRYGRFYTAKITEAFDAISRGDFIRPYLKEKMEVEQEKK
jgi:hypothetical protein